TTGSAMDRIVYLDASGKVVFGVNPGSITTIASAAGYADGAWHHVAAGLGAAGMQLFVDGSLVASNGAVTTAQNFTGYWRWGGSFGLSSWPNPPTSSAFVGEIQEFAVYGSQLSASQVSVHYHANH
ncbi:MAG TPA: LamG-like jellyroll fold domain-containing protein, partial [Acidimicrobiia bacterium]|nr:LamG-like jellyroll fold domain-containing protein [Acidimicrobiia bacterium]